MTKRSQVHWAFVGLAYITLLCQSILDNVRGPAYPDILSTFEMSASRGAQLFAWASFAGLISNLSARWWLPRVEVVTGSMISLLLMAAGSYMFGIAPRYGPYMIDLASITMGLGMGAANVAMNLLIARGTPLSHRRQFYSGLHSIYGLGSLSAPLLLSVYLSSQNTWDGFFRVFIILPIIIFILAVVGRKALRHESSDIKVVKPKLTAPTSIGTRLSYGCVFGFYVASEIVISTRLVLYLTTAHQIAIEDARLALSSFFLALLAGRLLFAVVPVKGASQRWLVASCILSIVFYFMSIFISPYILILCGLSMSYFYPVAMDWLSKKFPQGLEWMTASVLTNISIMLILMHLGFGLITDLLGINAAMGLVPLLQAICMLLLLLLGKAS